MDSMGPSPPPDREQAPQWRFLAPGLVRFLSKRFDSSWYTLGGQRFLHAGGGQFRDGYD